MGSSWLIDGGVRYVDELNWLLPINADELWIRDVFVSPQLRGRRAFSTFVGLMARHAPRKCRTIWSDVDWINRPSMQAHLAAGFTVFSRVKALDFLGTARLRSKLPTWHLPVEEMDPRSRWILLRGAARERHEALVA